MTELREIYRAAATRFLQSVVVVDDQTALTDEAQVAPEIIDPRPRSSPAVAPSKDASTADIVKDTATDEYRLDVRTLIDRFAALGIVCAALSPTPDPAETDEHIVKAGLRADMVTLDWHLGDAGGRARRLLDLLSGPANGRLRLIAIYTRDPKKDDLVQQINRLDGVKQLEDLRFQRGSTRIVLLFKEGSNQLEDQVVAVADLPERLVEEFTNLAAGLVSATAMSALGAAREAMPEILDVLNADLDAAYVGHRLALQRPDDAVDHLADLIVSELRSVIEDDAGQLTTAGGEAVRLWLDDIADSSALTVEQRNALHGLSQEGSSSKNAKEAIAAAFPQPKGTKKNPYPTKFLIADSADPDLADARFAKRMSTRHRYANARPARLELGVVIWSESEKNYWVCVQPLCDSVRLTEACQMPLLPLSHSEKDDGKGFDLVFLQTESLLKLRLKSRPANLRVVAFRPDPTAKAVVAVRLEDGSLGFIDDDKKQQTWKLVCRFKPEHAQRVVHRLGTEFTRVGLNESERWRIKVGR